MIRDLSARNQAEIEKLRSNPRPGCGALADFAENATEVVGQINAAMGVAREAEDPVTKVLQLNLAKQLFALLRSTLAEQHAITRSVVKLRGMNALDRLLRRQERSFRDLGYYDRPDVMIAILTTKLMLSGADHVS